MIEFSTATELLYSYSSIDLPGTIFFEASGATQATEPHRIFTENLAEQPHLFRCLLQFCKVGKYYSWLNTATLIIQQYNGAMPLAVFLKNFFSTQKKYGSKDRRQISALCYSYFRLGKLAAVNRDDLNDNKVQSLILAGLFLCSQEDNALLAALKPHWHDGIQQTLADKYATLQKEGILPPDGLRNLFPWPEALSTDVDQPAYNRAYLIQPLLFLRIRPGFKEKVIQQLQANQCTLLQLLSIG